MKRPYKEPY